MPGMLGWTVRQMVSEKTAAKDVVSQCLRRAEKTKGLNAFISLTPELAGKKDKNVKKKLPLAGVPLAVKDNFCIKGTRTTCGSKMLKSFSPPYTATVVERLLDAGAVLIGKTNMDEFGMGSGCTDSAFGATKNAWSNECVSGGSSGGSAVAVATGAAIAALGSDTGGSTTNPASYNGVAGFKPSYGVLSRHGLIPLVNSMDVPGIMARTVEDTAAVFNVVSGWDEKDSTTVQRHIKIKLNDKVSVKGLRVGIPLEYYTEHLSEEVVKIWRNIASEFEKNGAIVKEVSLPHTRHSIAVYSVLNQCEVSSNMARYTGMFYGLRGETEASTEQLYAQSRSLGLGEVVRRRILSGNYFLLAENYSSYFVKAMQVRRLIFEDFQEAWKKVDVLLAPVTLSDAPKMTDFLSLDSRAQSATQDYCTQPANMAGIPAVTVPVELSSRGLPLSLQLLGPQFQDNLVINAARFMEKSVDFHRHRRDTWE